MKHIKGILIIFLLASLPSFAGEKVDQVLSVKTETPVTIENVRGSIIIEGWNKAQVAVSGELDEKTEKFIFEKNSAGILIKVVLPKQLGHDSYSREDGSNLVIKIPLNSPVNFDGVSTDVSLAHLNNNTNIKSISGNVKANSIKKYIEISTISGNITAKKLSGKIALTSISGDINSQDDGQYLHLENVSGNITAISTASKVQVNNVSGEITLKLAQVNDITLNTVSDDINVILALNPNATVKASSVSGDISLKFNGNLQASFRLTSKVNDDIINNITQDKVKKVKYGSGAKLNFDVGNTNASVHINTVSGGIIVSK